MLNSLDLLVIVFMIMASLALLSLLLMWLIKNKTVRRISVCVASALTLYSSFVGVVCLGSYFFEQAVIGLIVGIASIGALVLTFVGAKKQNEEMEMIARIASSIALVAGLINLLLI